MPPAEPTTNPDATRPAPADPLTSLLARARRDRRLLSVHWELTHRCNQRCRHCFLAVGAADDAVLASQELDTEAALGVVDQLAALGVLTVTFSGGEPLLRADFFDLAAQVHRRRLAMRVYTNGTLLTAPAAARLAALHPLAVEISLYAATPATHDVITGVPGSWAASVTALCRLQALGVRTVCKTPLMAVNADQIAALAALAEEVGARFQPDPILTARVAGTVQERRVPLALRMSDAQLAGVLRPTLAQWAGCRQAAAATMPHALAGSGPLLCTIGRSALALDPYGTVFPCVEVRRSLGNVRSTPLAAIWHDTTAWAPYLRLSAAGSVTASDLAVLPACHTCRLAAYCVRCHGAAANETGDLYGPSPAHCRAARVRWEILSKLEREGA
jgi:AdoMet-dependent heme synthase